jgi:hypothetical protein
MDEQNINNLEDTNKPAENIAPAPAPDAAPASPAAAPLRLPQKPSECVSKGPAESIILNRPDWNWRLTTG